MTDGFNNTRQLAMYFHTAFRNVGLFGSFSIAGISAAKAIKNNPELNIYLICFSVALMIVSFLVNIFLLYRLLTLLSKFSELNMWIFISSIMMVIQVLFLGYAFYLAFNNNHFFSAL